MLAIALMLVGVPLDPLISAIKDYPATMTGRYFDVQGLGLTVGRLDVPCDSLRWEAILVDGKCYGYFGLTPSLFRIVLNGLCLPCFGQWSRLMMVSGGLLFFLSVFLLAVRRLGRIAEATLYALLICLGGSLVFIISDPYGYHEAILWADSFGLLAFWAMGAYVDTDRPGALLLALLSVFLSLNARFNVGLGVAAGCLFQLSLPVLARFRPLPGIVPALRLRPVLAAVAVIALSVAIPVLVNTLKFGKPTPPADAQRFYAQFPERLARIKDGVLQSRNFPCDAALYLSPGMITLSGDFPHIFPAYREYWFAGRPLPKRVEPYCASANIEAMDPMYSLTAAMPASVILFVAGIAAMVRRRSVPDLAPLVGAALACVPLFFLGSVTYRYTLDFLPLFALGGLAAWREVGMLRPWTRRAVYLLFTLLTVWGGAVNLSAGLFSGSPQPYMARWEALLYHALPGVDRDRP